MSDPTLQVPLNVSTNEKIQMLHTFWDKQRILRDVSFNSQQKDKHFSIQKEIHAKLNNIVMAS